MHEYISIHSFTYRTPFGQVSKYWSKLLNTFYKHILCINITKIYSHTWYTQYKPYLTVHTSLGFHIYIRQLFARIGLLNVGFVIRKVVWVSINPAIQKPPNLPSDTHRLCRAYIRRCKTDKGQSDRIYVWLDGVLYIHIEICILHTYVTDLLWYSPCFLVICLIMPNCMYIVYALSFVSWKLDFKRKLATKRYFGIILYLFITYTLRTHYNSHIGCWLLAAANSMDI